ncbi:hypothetical protein M1146_05950 [Patescibacteria group bacterium]|nr:hypothetical protein [Patescibacteria group bacterium]
MTRILKDKIPTYDEDELLEIIRASKPQDPNKVLPPLLKEASHVFVRYVFFSFS